MYEDEDLDTGVESQGAAETDEELEEQDTTQLVQEDDAPDNEVDFADLFKEESDEENAEDEGSGSPPTEDETEESQQEPKKPAEKQFSQSELNRIIQERLRQDRAAREKEQAAKLQGRKLDELIEADITVKAQKLIEDNPDMNMTLDFAKTIVRGQQPQVQQQPAQAEQTKEEKVQAWRDSFETDEPMIQADMRDPSLTVKDYADKDAVFKSVLLKGVTPLMAHLITKEVRAIMQQEITAAKAKGGQETIQKLQQSNARATAPVGGAKTTGRAFDAAAKIANMTDEEFDEFNRNALRHGKKVRV